MLKLQGDKKYDEEKMVNHWCGGSGNYYGIGNRHPGIRGDQRCYAQPDTAHAGK
jgi:hypothetical protein